MRPLLRPVPARLLASALALGLLACGGAEGSGSRRLEYYLSSDPRSLDPALSTDVQTGEMVTLLFDNLTRYDEDGRLGPGLASAWETADGGRRYTFRLRSGVTFHDGTPLTAREVRASFLRALAPGSGGRTWPLLPIAGARAYADGKAEVVPGIEAPDDTTVVITLEEPLNIFPQYLAMPATAIVPATVPADFGERPVGSGPWRFVSWAHDDALVLAKHPGHWGGEAASDTLRVRIIPEPLTQAAEYEAGQLSVVEIPFGETERWTSTRAAELQQRPTIRDLYIAINTTRGPLADARVRRALNHAVDVPTILKTVLSGRGVQAVGTIPPGIAGHDSTRRPYRHDPAEARRLLAAAGHANGVRLTLWRSQRPVYARVAQAVQQQLGAVGVTVEIVERDAATARAAVRKGEADLFLTDWYADYPDAENFQYPLFHSSNRGTGGNYAFLSDPALDAALVRARTTPDSSEKVRLAREIDAKVFELAPWIFLWHPVDMWAARPEVKGWRIPLVFNGQRWTGARVE